MPPPRPRSPIVAARHGKPSSRRCRILTVLWISAAVWSTHPPTEVPSHQSRPTSAGTHGGVLQCRCTRRPLEADASTTEPRTPPSNSEPLQGRRRQTAAKQTRAGSLSLLTTWARSDRKLGAPRLPQGHRPRPLRFCYSTASTVQESLDIQNSERRDREVDRSRGPEVKKSRDPQIGREVERQTEVQRIETTPEIHGSEERSRGREVQRSRGPQVQRSGDPEIRGEVHR